MEKPILSKQYLTDRTMFIEKVLQRSARAVLITRPPKSGKTTTLNMLREFLDITQDSGSIFQNLNRIPAKEMNSSPVICLSFSNTADNPYGPVHTVKRQLFREYRKYSFVTKNEDPAYQEKFSIYLRCMLDSSTPLSHIIDAVSFLAELLNRYYGKSTAVLIDEYDAPVINAYSFGCYAEFLSEYEIMLSSALKTSESVHLAALTGTNYIGGPDNMIVYPSFNENNTIQAQHMYSDISKYFCEPFFKIHTESLRSDLIQILSSNMEEIPLRQKIRFDHLTSIYDYLSLYVNYGLLTAENHRKDEFGYDVYDLQIPNPEAGKVLKNILTPLPHQFP